MTFPADLNFRRRRGDVTRCKSCRAPIVWALTQNGKRMPMDAAPVDGGGWRFSDGRVRKIVPLEHVDDDTLRYTAHWETCPNADDHRTARPREVA